MVELFNVIAVSLGLLFVLGLIFLVLFSVAAIWLKILFKIFDYVFGFNKKAAR